MFLSARSLSARSLRGALSFAENDFFGDPRRPFFWRSSKTTGKTHGYITAHHLARSLGAVAWPQAKLRTLDTLDPSDSLSSTLVTFVTSLPFPPIAHGAGDIRRPPVIHGRRVLGRMLQLLGILLVNGWLANNTRLLIQAPCTSALAPHPPSRLTSYAPRTRAHFTPQHWLLCHLGLY